MRSVKILTITGNELSSAATRCGACADERSSLIPFFGVIDALTHLWLRKFFNRERVEGEAHLLWLACEREEEEVCVTEGSVGLCSGTMITSVSSPDAGNANGSRDESLESREDDRWSSPGCSFACSEEEWSYIASQAYSRDSDVTKVAKPRHIAPGCTSKTARRRRCWNSMAPALRCQTCRHTTPGIRVK